MSLLLILPRHSMGLPYICRSIEVVWGTHAGQTLRGSGTHPSSGPASRTMNGMGGQCRVWVQPRSLNRLRPPLRPASSDRLQDRVPGLRPGRGVRPADDLHVVREGERFRAAVVSVRSRGSWFVTCRVTGVLAFQCGELIMNFCNEFWGLNFAIASG